MESLLLVDSTRLSVISFLFGVVLLVVVVSGWRTWDVFRF